MRRRTAYLIVLLALAAAWVVGLGCWPLLVWSPLNCSHEDIDIRSGRVRRQQYLLGLCVYESVVDTSLSRLLEAGIEDQPAEWHLVNTFSPMVRYSPHYLYHGAIWQIRELEILQDSATFAPPASRQMGCDILTLWQTGQGYFPVCDYLKEVATVISQRQGSKEPIEVKDLPTTHTIWKRRASEVQN